MFAPVETMASTMSFSISVMSAFFSPAETSEPASVRTTAHPLSASMSE